MTTDYARGFRAGIEAAARLHDRLSEWAYEAEEDPKCGQMHRDFAERIRALAPAAPEPLFAPREYEADDFGPIGDAARRICSHVDGDARENVYRAAKRELAALQPAPEPSEAKRMAAIEDRAILEMRRYTANGAPCSQPWGGCDVD